MVPPALHVFGEPVMRTPWSRALALAFPLVKSFAVGKKLRAALRDSHGGEYAEIVWVRGLVRKSILLLPGDGKRASTADHVLTVEAEARQALPWYRVFGAPGPERTWRRLGCTDVDTGMEELPRLLERAWQWLKCLTAVDVQSDYAAYVAHVRDQIVPIVERFADACDGEVRELSLWGGRILWPRSLPAFRLEIQWSSRNGIVLDGYRKEQVGGSLSESTWQCCENVLLDLCLEDWNKLGQLMAILEEARRRMENSGECSGTLVTRG